MSRLATLRKRARRTPVGTFLAVLIVNSALVVTALYAVFGSDFPTLGAIPYAWTPMVSAGVTVWLLDDSVRDWLGQLRNVRTGVHWYLVGIGIMLVATDFESIVAVLLGVDVVAPADSIGQYLLFFVVTLFLAGALEELGWRGFMQPRLQQRFSALTTSVVIGLVWAFWHVPLILAGAGTFTAFHEYIVYVVATSVILGWLYNNTKGALPVVMITHAASNMAPFGEVTAELPAIFDIVSGNIIFYVACATLIVLYAGWKTLTKDGTLPDIPGRRTERPLQHAD
jgi:membrane protease YdiL (CAAX protease family)